jgi:hypothetical protein
MCICDIRIPHARMEVQIMTNFSVAKMKERRNRKKWG